MPAQPASADAFAGRAGQDRRQLASTCSSPASRRRPAGWRRRACRSRSAGGTGTRCCSGRPTHRGRRRASASCRSSRSRTVARYSREVRRRSGMTPAAFGIGRDRRRSAGARRHVAGRARRCPPPPNRVAADRAVARRRRAGSRSRWRRVSGSDPAAHDVRTLQAAFLRTGIGRLHQKLHTPTSRTPLRDGPLVCALISYLRKSCRL